MTLATADPPFSGTIFIDPDIITSSDPSTFDDAVYAGQDWRAMFDRRVNDWVNVYAFLFDASYDDGLNCEIQVNPEFGSSDAAMVEALFYGTEIGRLPTVLRTDVETVWIHQGTELFGGGNNNILIHTGQTELYIADGILEETLVHESTHTSLDEYHATSSDWISAQEADGEFISTYAQDNPFQEDVAESFLTWLAVRYRSDRISQSILDTIIQTIPNRLEYFDNQSFNMYPIDSTMAIEEFNTFSIPESFIFFQNYPNPFNAFTTIRYELQKNSYVTISIYDINSRLVERLVNESQYAGMKTVVWNATDVSSGVYVYRIQAHHQEGGQAGEFVQTRKMVLLK